MRSFQRYWFYAAWKLANLYSILISLKLGIAFFLYHSYISSWKLILCYYYLLLILLVVQWKFAFLSMGRPEYLQDSDIVSNRFQVCLCLLVNSRWWAPVQLFFISHVLAQHINWLFWLIYLFKQVNVLICFPQRRDVYGAWEQYLGLEHSDNTPKRAYAVHQVRCLHTEVRTWCHLCRICTTNKSRCWTI